MKTAAVVGIVALVIVFAGAALLLMRPGGAGGIPSPDNTSASALVSDIQPGVGAGTPPSGVMPGQDGPWNHRIMGATSSDGLSWVKDNRVVSDQASVPNAILDNASRIRIYYVDWKNGGLSVAIANGSGWIYKKVQGVTPDWVDPDAVILPDGRYRLYASYMPYSGPQDKIISAISSDGITFQQESGVRYQEDTITDPDAINMGNVWRMFVSKGPVTVSTVSSDGLTFARENELPLSGSVTCTVRVDGGYRIYYHSSVPGKGLCIYSAFSQDGSTWVDEGLRLEPGAAGALDQGGVGDPAVVRMPDGSYRMYYKTFISATPPQNGTQPPPPPGEPSGISVEFTNSSYRIASGNTSGWFTTGQDADIMLSGIDFNNTGGPLLFSHPGSIASDGTHLLLADTWNNRVLIWNTPPAANTPPNLVLGQGDLYSNSPGKGLNQLNWPISVATDGQHVVVADTYNYRILIWNTFPTRNGQPADLVIQDGNTNDPKRSIGWPWGVWTNGSKLAISSTGGAAVLIWNTFPTQNNQSADICLRGDLGTPRQITSDGKHLIVADHNPRVGGGGMGGGSATFVWKTFPTVDNQTYDFYWSEWRMGTFTADGKLLLLGSGLFVWNSFPESASDTPDLTVGVKPPGQNTTWIWPGDYGGVAIAGGRVYVCTGNGNKIVAFNSMPTTDRDPDFVVGAPDLYTNTLEANHFITNPVPATDGRSLFISSDFDRTLHVWRDLPDESGAWADVVYTLPVGPWDNEIFNNTLILAGQDTVYVWRTLPLNGELPDLVYSKKIGSASFNDLRGVALDSRYFYLADRGAGKIYVWEGLPNNDTNPRFAISTTGPTRLSSDGTYLVVAATEAPFNERIKLYRISELSSNPTPILLTGININLPGGALVTGGHLFVADTVNSRVLIWNSISDMVAGRPPDVVLGEENFDDTNPAIGKDKLFWPAGLAFDGKYLWVGEFKFSGRVLRFSPH
jgi:hypothetical protein